MKLKKCTSLFLAFLVLISSIGFALNVHFCGDAVASISFKKKHYAAQEKKCCAVNEKDSSCCKDTVVHVEKKTPNAIVKAFVFQAVVPFLSPNYSVVSSELILVKHNKKVLSYYVDANAPPLFKLYHQFVFYA